MIRFVFVFPCHHGQGKGGQGRAGDGRATNRTKPAVPPCRYYQCSVVLIFQVTDKFWIFFSMALSIIFVLLVLVQCRIRFVGSSWSEDTKEQCRVFRREYLARPGKSWGMMDSAQQDEWIKLKCDDFFCEIKRRNGDETPCGQLKKGV